MDEIKQAKEEYLKKFLADVEKLAEKDKRYNENEVKYNEQN